MEVTIVVRALARDAWLWQVLFAGHPAMSSDMRDTTMFPTKYTALPAIPKKFTRHREVHWWGRDYKVKPAVVNTHLGDGKLLLWFSPLNTRPDYYLIRVDSTFFGEPGSEADYDNVADVIEAIAEEYGEKEREREHLAEDLREQGIEPTGENTDLAGNEGRLGWPVLSLDSGYTWGREE